MPQPSRRVPPKRKVSVYLTSNEAALVDANAYTLGQSRSDYIRTLVLQHLAGVSTGLEIGVKDNN